MDLHGIFWLLKTKKAPKAGGKPFGAKLETRVRVSRKF